MATVAQSPSPVRHGTCGLYLRINAVPYRLRKLPWSGAPRGFVQWKLEHLPSGPRPGVWHVVTCGRGTIFCTCEDSVQRGAYCKHMRAIQACGLAGKRLRPAAARPLGPAPAAPSNVGGC